MEKRRKKRKRLCAGALATGAVCLALALLPGSKKPGLAAAPQSGPAGETESETPEGTETETAAQTEEIVPISYPRSLIEFMEKYPEASQFVLDYPEKKDKHPDIDLSQEVSRGEIPLFLQWDERWGYETYGDDLMGINGCGPTCLSMVYCGLSGDTKWDPYQVACMADEQGYYVNGTGSSWELMDMGAVQMGLNVYEVPLGENDILNTLMSGKVMICSVRPGDFTDSGHFIVLCGTDDEGKIIVHDPNSRINSEQTWDMERLVPQIKGLWAYDYDE